MYKNINNLLALSPYVYICGIFNNLWGLKQSENNFQHFLTTSNMTLTKEITNILNYSHCKYQKHFKDTSF